MARNIVVPVRTSKETKERLKQYSADHDVSISQICNQAIENALKDEDVQEVTNETSLEHPVLHQNAETLPNDELTAKVLLIGLGGYFVFKIGEHLIQANK